MFQKEIDLTLSRRSYSQTINTDTVWTTESVYSKDRSVLIELMKIYTLRNKTTVNKISRGLY